ncbi:hypothetical protein [Myroides phaeus]|uniref:hypothetical protein n=1 Tax=Myroides phaeus TaxID=702745 RepID=UPI001303DBA0|nr:hypothetical protein [Myroides phaeus]
MKRIKGIIVLGALCCLPFGTVFAQEKRSDMKEEKVFYDEDDKRLYKRILKDEKGKVIEVEDNGFMIDGKPQKMYKGVYKEGKPFEGYFKEEKILSEINLINYYEQGERKAQYSYDYLARDQFAAPFMYDLETVYEGGKVKSGRVYKEVEEGNALGIVNYENFEEKSLFIDLFEMHYFNRISFELTDDQLSIKDMSGESLIVVKKAGNKLTADYFIKGQHLFTAKPFIEVVKKGSPLSMTVYYKDKKEVEQEFSFKRLPFDSNMDQFANQFLTPIFLQFPAVYEGSLEQLLSAITSKFDVIAKDLNAIESFADLLPFSVYPFDEKKIVGVEEYDEKGQLVKE